MHGLLLRLQYLLRDNELGGLSNGSLGQNSDLAEQPSNTVGRLGPAGHPMPHALRIDCQFLHTILRDRVVCTNLHGREEMREGH